jgi:hypothetical protein
MKRTIKNFLILFTVILTQLSCKNDFFDATNPSSITADEVWKDKVLIEFYLNRLYNDRPGYDQTLYNNITDESRRNTAGAPYNVLLGSWNAVTNPMEFWAYDRVRRANEFLKGVETVQILSNTEKSRMKGEAKFLRAFLYFDMVKRYGGVPLISNPQDITEDLEVPRNTIDECFTFIHKELDEAIAMLPETSVKGKANKGAAMALKARSLLYYASPLYNTGNNANRWKEAADANRKVMELGKYNLWADLKTLWLDPSNTESIFEVQYKLPEKQHGWDSWNKPLILANNAAGNNVPLQELVNAFPMKDGKTIGEQGSGYDPANPYVGRDNRFYAFIGYNQAKMKGTTSGPPVREITLEIYNGGRDYNASPANAVYNTLTGYYVLKMINPENTIYGSNAGSSQPWIELRYAEVLLNYAEAQNEFLGAPDASIYTALNQLRRRAGITTDLVAGSLNKDEMRNLIQNERYVELSYEHKRYWDLRRWKTAAAKLNGKKFTGVVITKQPNGTFTYQYAAVDSQPAVFAEYMYFMPIPQTEISKNRKLTQNPGWN